MGAWIEIQKILEVGADSMVAPHMGAWIEIPLKAEYVTVTFVAPHMGAWIEIDNLYQLFIFIKSHPTWVRGLKFADDRII